MTGLGGTDVVHLRAALRVAARAREQGNLPFGCVVADGAGEVVIEQGNAALVPVRDPTAHAETLAAGLAARRYEPEDAGAASRSIPTPSRAPCAPGPSTGRGSGGSSSG